MSDVAVGIDIGTSYIKAVARSEDGSIVAVNRLRSPQFSATTLPAAAKWWECFKRVLQGLLNSNSTVRLRVAAICVSAITPTLVVFDAANEDKAYAILYSSLAELENGTSLSQCDPQLTDRRLAALRSAARVDRFISPCITDLVGYLNWRLTTNLTINSISLAETGLSGGTRDCEKFAVVDNVTPRLVAPSQQIGEITKSSSQALGVKSGIAVCGGCPDTMSSVIGAGLLRESEMMLYLGTFGSLMRLESDVDPLLDVADCPNPPFRWLLSVPGLGPEIEALSSRWFRHVADSLRLLDKEAERASPGADGTLFLVPRWKAGMTAIGQFELLPDKKGEIGSVQRQSRAVLEGIGYAILASGQYSSQAIKTAGGGARSRTWLDILSAVLNVDVLARHMTWEAIGAADIAARLAWRHMPSPRPSYTSKRQAKVSRAIINENLRRAKEQYHEHNWL